MLLFSNGDGRGVLSAAPKGWTQPQKSRKCVCGSQGGSATDCQSGVGTGQTHRVAVQHILGDLPLPKKDPGWGRQPRATAGHPMRVFVELRRRPPKLFFLRRATKGPEVGGVFCAALPHWVGWGEGHEIQLVVHRNRAGRSNSQGLVPPVPQSCGHDIMVQLIRCTHSVRWQSAKDIIPFRQNTLNPVSKQAVMRRSRGPSIKATEEHSSGQRYWESYHLKTNNDSALHPPYDFEVNPMSTVDCACVSHWQVMNNSQKCIRDSWVKPNSHQSSQGTPKSRLN